MALKLILGLVFVCVFQLSGAQLLFGGPDFSKLSSESFKNLGQYRSHEFPVTLTCNTVLFGQCLTQLYQNAGLVGPFNTPAQLGQALQNKIMSQGTAGILQICNANSLFTQCMGPQMAAVCMNPLSQIQNGVTYANAIGFATIYYQTHFACGGGLMTVLYNWPCIRQTIVTRNATIVQCARSFIQNITNDYPHYCQYGQQYIQCMANIFNAPQCNSAAGWYECEVARIAVLVPRPLCPVRCMVQRSSQVVAKMETEPKSETGKDFKDLPSAGDHGDILQKGMQDFLGNAHAYLQQIAKMAQKEKGN